jgi:hypothetical protein
LPNDGKLSELTATTPLEPVKRETEPEKRHMDSTMLFGRECKQGSQDNQRETESKCDVCRLFHSSTSLGAPSKDKQLLFLMKSLIHVETKFSNDYLIFSLLLSLSHEVSPISTITSCDR